MSPEADPWLPVPKKQVQKPAPKAQPKEVTPAPPADKAIEEPVQRTAKPCGEVGFRTHGAHLYQPCYRD